MKTHWNIGTAGWPILTAIMAVLAHPAFAQLLPAPTLTGPANGATGFSTTPTLSWTAVSGANRYWVTMSTRQADLPTNPSANSCQGCLNSGGISVITTSTSHTAGNTSTSEGYIQGTTRALQPNTTYYWKVQSYVQGGQNGNYSSVRSFTTAGAVQVPTVETLPASSIAASSATLNGRVVNNGGATITDRRFEWAKNSGNWGTGTQDVDWGLVNNTSIAGPDSGFGAVISGLQANTTYKYRVYAWNSAGPSLAGSVNVVMFTTSGAAGTPTVSITTPSGNQTVPNGTTSYPFSGSATAPGSTVAGVEWRLNTGNWTAASGTASWNFTVQNLVVGQNVVEVRSRNSQGTLSQIASRTITRESVAGTTIRLRVPWDKPGDPNVSQIQYWVPQTYDNHLGSAMPDNNWNEARRSVDFYFAAIQSPNGCLVSEDSAAAGRGKNVRAAHAGTVSRFPDGCGHEMIRVTGIDMEGNAVSTDYIHLLPIVNTGASVAAGHIIGTASNHGCANWVHVMLKVYRGTASTANLLPLDDPNAVLFDGDVVFRPPAAQACAGFQGSVDQGRIYRDGALPRGIPPLPQVSIVGLAPSPSNVAAGAAFSINAVVHSSQSRQVLLGASLFPAGMTTGRIDDPLHDGSVALNSGINNVARQFTVPAGAVAGLYDLQFAVWEDSNGDGRINSPGDTLLAGPETIRNALTVEATPPPDTIAPSLVVSSPADGATVATSSVTVSGTATDSGRGNSGINSVRVNDVRADNDTAAGGATASWSGSVSLLTGPNNISVVATDGAGNQTTSSISVTYTPPSTRIIALSGDLTFGDVAVGASAQRTLTIANSGNANLNVSSLSYPSGFTGNWSSGPIAAGGSQSVTVTFSPTAATGYGGPVTVNSDRTSGGNTIQASGTGIMTLLNDTCVGAIALTAGLPHSTSTLNATTTGDPTPPCQGSFGKGVWYTFTPASSGMVMISTCGSDFDTVLAVFSGDCGAALVSVECEDDNGPACSGEQSSVSFNGTAGTTYRILVGGWRSRSGNLEIVATVAPGPYTITASAGPGGTVNPSGIVTRNAGESLPFLATPNAGHAVHQWLVNENMVQTGGNSYTLTNIQADWSVRVTFAPRLSYARQADEIVISWPASDPGYRLEYAVQLPPKAWIQNPVFPSLADGRYWVKEGPTDQIRVYRLKK